jgi:hypothetical protein
MMSAQLYITGTKQHERPRSRCTIFADGSAGTGMREGIDLEM